MSALEGLDEVMKNLNSAIAGLQGASLRGLEAAALHIGAEAAKRAPLDTGNLRGSMSVYVGMQEVAKGTTGGGLRLTGSARPGDAPVATIGFGAPYAAKQHEHVEYTHPLGGEAKFLESAVKENADKIVAFIAEAIRKELGT